MHRKANVTQVVVVTEPHRTCCIPTTKPRVQQPQHQYAANRKQSRWSLFILPSRYKQITWVMRCPSRARTSWGDRQDLASPWPSSWFTPLPHVYILPWYKPGHIMWSDVVKLPEMLLMQSASSRKQWSPQLKGKRKLKSVLSISYQSWADSTDNTGHNHFLPMSRCGRYCREQDNEFPHSRYSGTWDKCSDKVYWCRLKNLRCIRMNINRKKCMLPFPSWKWELDPNAIIRTNFTIEKASSSTNNGAGRMYGKRFLHLLDLSFIFFKNTITWTSL